MLIQNGNIAQFVGKPFIFHYLNNTAQKQSLRGVSVKMVFLKILQNSQEDTCAREFLFN